MEWEGQAVQQALQRLEAQHYRVDPEGRLRRQGLGDQQGRSVRPGLYRLYRRLETREYPLPGLLQLECALLTFLVCSNEIWIVDHWNYFSILLKNFAY